MNRDRLRLADERFIPTLLHCHKGDLIEIEHQGGYYVGQLVQVNARQIIIAPHGKRANCISEAMTPADVYEVTLPTCCVIGFENRGQRYARLPRISAL